MLMLFNGGGDATPSAHALGDSYTEGLEGDTGGWRVRMATEYNSVGPFTDPTGARHAGRGGDMMVSSTDPDMIDRFATDWALYPADEVWVEGGTNDLVSGGDVTAAAMVADATTLNSNIVATVGTNVPIRWQTLPPISASSDATILAYNQQKLHQMVALSRAAGNQVFLHDTGGRVTIAGLAPGIVKHPDDVHAEGYPLWASSFDAYLSSSTAVDPDDIGVALAYWYRADQVNLTGAAIDSFIDLSSNGRTLSPFNASNKAQQIDGHMGQKAAAFTADPYRLTGFEVAQPNTVFMVIDGVSATGSPALLDAATTATTKRNLFQVQSTGAVSMFAGTTVTDSEMNATTIGHAYMAEFNTTSSKLNVDGCRRDQTKNVGVQACDGITLGGSAAATPSNTATFNLYEVICFTGVLTLTQERQVWMYLRNRYGLWPLLGQTVWVGVP